MQIKTTLFLTVVLPYFIVAIFYLTSYRLIIPMLLSHWPGKPSASDWSSLLSPSPLLVHVFLPHHPFVPQAHNPHPSWNHDMHQTTVRQIHLSAPQATIIVLPIPIFNVAQLFPCCTALSSSTWSSHGNLATHNGITIQVALYNGRLLYIKIEKKIHIYIKWWAPLFEGEKRYAPLHIFQCNKHHQISTRKKNKERCMISDPQ